MYMTLKGSFEVVSDYLKMPSDGELANLAELYGSTLFIEGMKEFENKFSAIQRIHNLELEKKIEKLIEDQREYTLEAILVNEISSFAVLPTLNEQGQKLLLNQETQTEIEEQKESILKELSINLLIEEKNSQKGPASLSKVEAKRPGV